MRCDTTAPIEAAAIVHSLTWSAWKQLQYILKSIMQNAICAIDAASCVCEKLRRRRRIVRLHPRVAMATPPAAAPNTECELYTHLFYIFIIDLPQ
jgi:hypothetical protein